jgi:hypothetical protein
MSDTASDQSFEVAARYETDDDARQAVEALTLRGVGATWEQRSSPDSASTGGDFAVLVVPGEASRAREILGFAAPPERDSTSPSAASERRKQIFWVLVVFGLAMIIIPAIAFFVSFKLSGG